jgi:hypothetical protein
MGSFRTLKRRRQRQAHKAAIAARRAEWAALSPEERQHRKQRRGMLDQMNRLAYETALEYLRDQFKESPFLHTMRTR